jgi:ketosteroid isomerase-like protein
MARLVLVLFSLVGLGLGADRSADAVKAAEKSWATATLAGDEATLKQVLADDLTYTHSNGDTDSKAVFIDNLKTGVRKYHRLEHESMEVRLYGSTAVLVAPAKIATSQKGGPINPVRLRFLHVWIFQKGRWQLVAHQSLRLPN